MTARILKNCYLSFDENRSGGKSLVDWEPDKQIKFTPFIKQLSEKF